MSAELPPLYGGQVWVNDELIILVGPLDSRGMRRFTLARSLRLMTPDSCPDDELRRDYLSFYKCRLIYGPGSPWSPEETSRV